MKLLDTVIEPGTQQTIELSIATLYTGTPLTLPIIVSRGKKEGPCLLLTAGIHGDELNGVEIVRQIIAKGYCQPDAGTVICMPVINVFGFLNQSREFPDGRDLNRLFPGTKRGSLASRFAYHLANDIVPHIDYCIDYHTGGDARFNYAQIRLDASQTGLLPLAEVFGTKFIITSKQLAKSFRSLLSKKEKPVLLFEGGKTLHLDRTVTKVGIRGALLLMQHLGMRDFSTVLEEEFPEVQRPAILVEDSTWIRARRAGMFRTMKKLGSFVKKGDVLGTISDPFGSDQTQVRAPVSGYVFCANHAPIVNQGDALIHISRLATPLP